MKIRFSGRTTKRLKKELVTAQKLKALIIVWTGCIKKALAYICARYPLHTS